MLCRVSRKRGGLWWTTPLQLSQTPSPQSRPDGKEMSVILTSRGADSGANKESGFQSRR